MKILFFRTPRFRWAFHSEHSSFWQPLGFCSMASVLRENLKYVDIKIIDCPAQKIGWKTARKILLDERPDILCLGEEAVSVHEAFKAIHFAKRMMPGMKVIVGGTYFTYMVHESLQKHPIDFVVKFEGEMTLLELVKELHKKEDERDFKKIKGIAYLTEGTVVETPLRELLDMEKLPMPAYDLLDMDCYGKGSKSHKDFVAIEHSRGCTCSCNFCILWKQMGKINLKKGVVEACYRTKSPKKTVDEIEYIRDRWGRKTFCWVDPTWNVDPKWNLEFAELCIARGIKVDHSVWLRADFIVRDEKQGIFKKLAEAGLKQAMIGVERTDDDDLEYFEKTNYTFETVKKAFEIVHDYKNVLSVATYIFGVPDESRESLNKFYKQLAKIPFDVGIPIPLTPNPGTKFFEELQKKNLLEIKNFSYYNFINPVARSKYLSRNQLLMLMVWNEIKARSRSEQLLSKIFLKTAGRRRKKAISNVALSKAIMTYRYFYGIMSEWITGKAYNYNIRPKWYGE